MDRPEAVPRLKWLLESVSTLDVPQGLKLPTTIRLDSKDPPILWAAIIYERFGYEAKLTPCETRPGGYGRRMTDNVCARPPGVPGCSSVRGLLVDEPDEFREAGSRRG
jgi:hypothetical protein